MQRDFFGGENINRTSKSNLPLRILKGVLLWAFLFALGIFSFIFPPIGIPFAVLLYHNGKKIYALFPTLGILLLIFFQLYNQLMLLLTR